MSRCKFDRTLKCVEVKCDERCSRFRKSGQQTFGKPQPPIIKRKVMHGVETVYYKKEKEE